MVNNLLILLLVLVDVFLNSKKIRPQNTKTHMKKIFFLILFTLNSCFIYSQSPSIFSETIHYVNCNYVMAEFHHIGNNPTYYDSVCWDFGDGRINCWTQANTTIRRNYHEPGLYTVTLTVWRNGESKQITKPDLIKVYKAPEALFTHTISDTILIAPLQIDFQNQSISGDGDSITYLWEINYYSETSSNDTNFSYFFEKAGTYDVQLTLNDNNGCRASYSETVIIKDSIQINEFKYITSGCDPEDPCQENINYKIENDTLKLFGQIGGNCCTDKTAVIIDNVDTVQIRTFDSGLECTCNCLFCFEINIPEFTRDSCIIMFNNRIINTNINSISTRKIEENITIMPNPFNELINLEINNVFEGSYRVEIFNIQGQLIQSKIITNKLTSIDMSNYSKGIYLLTLIKNDKIIMSEKLIKK